MNELDAILTPYLTRENKNKREWIERMEDSLAIWTASVKRMLLLCAKVESNLVKNNKLLKKYQQVISKLNSKQSRDWYKKAKKKLVNGEIKLIKSVAKFVSDKETVGIKPINDIIYKHNIKL